MYVPVILEHFSLKLSPVSNLKIPIIIALTMDAVLVYFFTKANLTKKVILVVGLLLLLLFLIMIIKLLVK